jgi:GT2 family glycosyltransferase
VADDTTYSVVVVTHNHADTLPACLTAVAALEPPPQKVVIVDNASRDGSPDVPAGWAATLPLQLQRQQANSGFAAAINHGIRATDSGWVLSLNPDCAPRPDFVARLMEGVRTRPESDTIGCATGKLIRADGPELRPDGVLDAAGMVVTCSGRHFDRGAGETGRGQFDRRAWVFGGTGAATLYRRRALEDVAYPEHEAFAESFFAYREDAELAWRLQWRGWRCLYEPSAVAAHGRTFRPEDGRRGHTTINQLSVRNRFLLRLHCADLGWHVGCFPWWLGRDLMVIGACLTVERSSLSGLAQFWRLRRDAVRRRRWVMSRRTTPSRRLRRWFRTQGWTEEIVDE